MRKSDMVLSGAVLLGLAVTAPMWWGPLKRSYQAIGKPDVKYDYVVLHMGGEYTMDYNMSKEDCLARLETREYQVAYCKRQSR